MKLPSLAEIRKALTVVAGFVPVAVGAGLINGATAGVITQAIGFALALLVWRVPNEPPA